MPSSWLSSGLAAKLLAEWNIAEQAGETDAAAIVQLDDTGGSGLHGIQATSGNRAIYRANRLNGLGAAEFVSSDSYASTLSASNFDESYIAVVRADSFATFPTILGDDAGGGRQWRFTSSGQLQFVRSGVANFGNSTATALLNVPTIVFSTLKNGSQVWSINGLRETGSTGGALTASRTTHIGARSVTAEPFDGDILYVAAMSELTQSEQEEYEGLLADLFGIPLVMGHPERRATRFYLPSSGSAAISPSADAEWDEAGSVTRIGTAMTRGSTAFSSLVVTESSSTVSNRDILIAQYVSEPLVAGSFGGLIKAQVRASESATGANYRTQLIARMLSGDGSTVRGALYAGDLATLTGNPVPELTTTLVNRRFPRVAGYRGAKLSWSDGDRVIFEIGVREHNTVATLFTSTLRAGENSATALGENETETTDNHPWIDVGYAFSVYTPPVGSAGYPHSRIMSIG